MHTSVNVNEEEREDIRSLPLLEVKCSLLNVSPLYLKHRICLFLVYCNIVSQTEPMIYQLVHESSTRSDYHARAAPGSPCALHAPRSCPKSTRSMSRRDD